MMMMPKVILAVEMVAKVDNEGVPVVAARSGKKKS